MKKLFFISFIFLFSFGKIIAQQQDAVATINSFPYQFKSDVSKSLASMESWDAKSWKSLLKMLDDDSLKLKATYALNAYVSHAANDAAKSKAASVILSKGFS